MKYQMGPIITLISIMFTFNVEANSARYDRYEGDKFVGDKFVTVEFNSAGKEGYVFHNQKIQYYSGGKKLEKVAVSRSRYFAHLKALKKLIANRRPSSMENLDICSNPMSVTFSTTGEHSTSKTHALCFDFVNAKSRKDFANWLRTTKTFF